MNLFSGLEKLGLKVSKTDNLFEDEKQEKQENPKAAAGTGEIEKQETDFLFAKTIECPICDKKFQMLMVKGSKLQRLEADDDLRPRHKYIDSLKYGVTSCPYCRYSALNDRFDRLSTLQRKLIREGIYSQVQQNGGDVAVKTDGDIVPYDYDTAIEFHKLAVYSAMVKKAKDSEKAFTCLKLAWLYRSKVDELTSAAGADEKAVEEARQEGMAFYEQAYQGFSKAMTKEAYPICGMGESTLDYLLAVIAYNLGDYDASAKLVGAILVSKQPTEKLKDKARDLKEKIAEAKK